MARIVLSAGVIIASGTNVAHAAAWNVSGEGSVLAGHDDNVRLSLNDVPSTDYASTAAAVHLALQDAAWSWTLDPRAVITRYAHYSVLNRSETYVDSQWQQQSETAKSSLAFNWTRDTTLTSELGLTGLAETNKPHQSTALTLSHTQQWTELVDTQGQLYVTSNHYMQAQNTGLVNYNYESALLAVDYTLTARSQLSINGSVGKLQVPNLSAYDKTNQSVTLNYSVSFAERWQGKFSVGPAQAKSDFSTESGIVYEFNVSRKSETSSVQLKLARDITPTGQGVLTRRQQINLNVTRALTERLNIGVSGSLTRNDNLLLANNSNVYGVQYNEVSANLSWRWTPTWIVALTAGHTTQQLEISHDTARRNYVSLNLGWVGLPHSLH